MLPSRLAALFALAVLVALAGGPQDARAAPADRLVIHTQEVPGLRSGSSGIIAARREFARLAPKRARKVQSARYRGPGRVRLEVRAAELRTVGHAKVTYRVWRKTERKRGFRARSLGGTGGPALIAVRRRGGTSDVRIALRRRAGVALIRYRTRHGARVARRIATGLARIEGRRLDRALSRTAWDRAIDGIRADGSVPDRTVLQLTSLLYGQVPGVKVPGGARRVRESNGTWVLEHLRAAGSRLSPARRRAVARALRGRPPSGKAAAKGNAKRSAQTGCQTEVGGRPLDVALSTLGASFRDAMAARVPGYGTPTWHVCVYRASDPGISAAADTVPYQTPLTSDPFDLGFFDPLLVTAGTFDMCHVRIHPSFNANSEINRRWALAHEMYHCLRQETNGQNAYDAPKPPPWAEEGLADWAAHEVSPASYVPVSNLPANHYSKYLETSFNGLFGQSYDAFGFFGRVEQTIGASALWSRVTGVWAAGSSSQAAYAAITGADEQKILSEWGSGLFRRPDFPPPWFQQRPFANTSPSAEVRLVSPAAPGISRHEVSDHRPELLLAVSPIPLVRVTIEGAGRVSDGTTDWPEPVERWFCFGGGCTCPTGQTESRAIPEHTDLPDGFLYSGIAAGAGTSALVLDAHSLSEYCDPEETPEGPVPPGGGGSNGDPHLVTFDGRRYDFQAAGEFVLARGPGIEVQARQEPWRRSRYVSINTQIAFKVGPAKVVVSPGKVPLVDTGRGPRRLGSRVGLRGGGSVAPAPQSGSCADLVVRWPNGSVACVFSVGPWGLALRVVPGPAVRGKMTGLLGDADGDQADDFRTRAGRRLNPRLMNGRGRAGYTALYRTFGDSWRVRPAESLLRYARGQRTSTFTDRDFPARAYGLRDLSASRRSRAEARCRARGVRDPELLEDCTVDVALTGRTAFATAAAEEQRVAVPPPTKIGDGDRPWVLVDRGGTTHVAWRRSMTTGPDELHYRRRGPSDAEFGPEQVLPFDAAAATEDSEGPVILQDPAPSERLVILASRCCRGPGTYALTSGDGGATWSTGTAVYEGAFGTGPENGRSNTAAFAGGTIQIVSGGKQIAPLPAALAPLQPRGIARPGADAVFDSAIATGPDGPVLAWSDLDRGSVRIGATGATFDAGPVRTVDIAGGARATVLLTTSDESIGRRLEARPVGGGGLGTPTRVSAAGDGDPIFPWLGTDSAGGFHAVWVTSRRDLAYSRSADGGSWSAPKPLAYAPEGSGIYHPVVGTGPAGGWAVWDENGSAGSVYAAPVPAG